MPKFLKLKFRKRIPVSRSIVKEGEVEQEFYQSAWVLTLSNEEEFNLWSNYDAEATIHSYMTLADKNQNSRGDYSHLGGLSTREEGLARAIQMAKYCSNEEKIYPIIEAAKINDLKQAGILRAIRRGNTVALHANGMGWCILKSYMETWDAEIVNEVVKDKFSFPIEDEAINAKTIVLENAPKDDWKYKCMRERVKEMVADAGDISFIFSLKEVDERYVFKAIMNAANIYIESEFEDENQLSYMANAFMNIPQKNIYIRAGDSAQKRLFNNPLYQQAAGKHNITVKDYR